MAHPLAVTDDSFQTEVLASTTPVLVDFWAEWCGPCRQIAPVVEEIATEYDSRLKVTKLDVDANPVTAGQYGVMSIPTLLVFVNGQPVERIVGYRGRSHLLSAIDAVVSGVKA